MPRKTSQTSKTSQSRAKQNIAAEFTRTRDFITRYSHLPDPEADVITVWAMGTWCFSPMCQWPATYPYLYITGPAGSGKTVLMQDALGSVVRMWKSAAGATGPTLYRLLGREDEETGEIENLAPTLAQDEIDATFSGAKDEALRLAYNVGYKRGATIPRSAGKTSFDFPVYGPKIMAGIENGHLPETVTQRSIRIEVERLTQDQKTEAGIEDFFVFDVEDESADIQQELSDWAKQHSMILREYRPKPPEGLTARQWEISRSLVQLAKAIGGPDFEARIIAALRTVFTRVKGQVDARTRLYRAINQLFQDTGLTVVTNRQILAKLAEEGVAVSGNSGKGLSALLVKDDIGPKSVGLKPDHPEFNPDRPAPNGRQSHRGYELNQFDAAFVRYLTDEDE